MCTGCALDSLRSKTELHGRMQHVWSWNVIESDTKMKFIWKPYDTVRTSHHSFFAAEVLKLYIYMRPPGEWNTTAIPLTFDPTLHTYLLTYLLTPWCRILLEKLIVPQLVKNIPLSYGTRRFITVFTKARHWTLSWASRIQFAPSIPISLRSILMLSSHLRLGLPNQNPVNTSPLPHACHMSRPPHPPWFNHPNNIRRRIQVMKLIIILLCIAIINPDTWRPAPSLLISYNLRVICHNIVAVLYFSGGGGWAGT
jgi:hypothetical protein